MTPEEYERLFRERFGTAPPTGEPGVDTTERDAEGYALLANNAEERVLQDARRAVAADEAPEKAPEPEAPEVPMETETTTTTSQDAGADGSGAKRSEKVEKSRPAGVPDEAAPPPEGGEEDASGTFLGGTAADYAKAPLHGVAEAGENTEKFVLSAAKNFFGLVEGQDAVQLDDPSARPESVFTLAKRALAFSNPDALGPKLVSGLTQILVPYAAVSKAGAALGLTGSVVKSGARMVGADVIASAVAIDPYEERLSTMLNAVPWLERVIPDYLASNDENAPYYEGVIKNALEAGAIAMPLEALMEGLRVMRAAKKASQVAPEAADAHAARGVAREDAINEAVEGRSAVDRGMAQALAEGDEARAAGKLDTGDAELDAELRAAHQEQLAEDEYLDSLSEREREEYLAGLEEEDALDDFELSPEEAEAGTAYLDETYFGEGRYVEPEPELEPEVSPKELEAADERQKRDLARQSLREQALSAGGKPPERKPGPSPAQQRRLEKIKRRAPRMEAVQTPGKGRQVEKEGGVEAVGERLERQVRASFASNESRELAASLKAVDDATRIAGDMVRDMEALQLGTARSGLTSRFSIGAKVRKTMEETDATLRARTAMAKGVQRAMWALADVREVAGFEELATQAQVQRTVGAQKKTRRDYLPESYDELPEAEQISLLRKADEALEREGGAKTQGRLYGRVMSMGTRRGIARRLVQERTAALRHAVMRYEWVAKGGDEAALPASRVEQARAAEAEVTARDREFREGVAESPEALASAALRQQEVVRALWKNRPVDTPVAIAPETHAQAVAGKILSREVLDRDGTLMGMDNRQSLIDLSATERDAMTIAPLPARPEHAGGIDDVAEDASREGLQVNASWGQDVEDFAAAGELVRGIRGGKATDERNLKAHNSLMAMRAEIGPEFTNRSLRPEVAEDAAPYLDMLYAMSNDLKRASGSAVAGARDLASTHEAKLLMERLGAYTHWLYGNDVRAKEILKYSPYRQDYYQMDDAARFKLGMRQGEKAGGRMSAPAAAFRAADGFEHMLRAVVSETDAPIRTGVGARLVHAMVHMRASSMLSAPTTHVKNAIGNGASLLTKVPTSYLSSLIRTGGDFGAASRETAAMLEGFNRGTRMMFEIANRSRIRQGYAGQAVRDQQEDELKGTLMGTLLEQFIRNDKFDIAHAQTEYAGAFGQRALSGGRVGILVEAVHGAEDLHAGFGAAVRNISGYLSAGVDAPLATLQASDMVFKMVAYQMELGRLASIATRDPDEKLAILEHSFKKESGFHDLHQQALRYAEQATFTQKLNPMNQKVLDWMNNSLWGVPRIVMPFYTVLMNMGRVSLSYLPGAKRLGAALNRDVRAQLQEMSDLPSNLTALERTSKENALADHRARQWIGAGMLTSGLALYSAGILTGGAPSKGQFKRSHAQLRQPYSLRVGDTWVGDYRELLPGAGAIIAMGADAAELMYASVTDEEAKLAELATGLVMSATENLLDQTAINTVGDWFEDVQRINAAYEGGTLSEKGAAIAIRNATSVAATLIPYGAFTKRLADAVDGGTRRRLEAAGVDTDGTLLSWYEQLFGNVKNEVSRRMLWTSDELPAIRGWDGELLHRAIPSRETGFLGGMAAFMNPLAMMRHDSRDPSIRAMLDNETAPDWVDRNFYHSAAGLDVKTPLMPEEYEWLAERRGKLIRRKLDAVTQTEWFKSWGPGIDQQNALKAVFASAERQAEAELMARYDNIGVRLHKELQREMDRARAEAAARALQGGS